VGCTVMSTCEAAKCTRQAVYHVSVKTAAGQGKADFERDYCPAHTRGLGHEIARKMDGYGRLHEYLDVEFVQREHVNA
jgi:hypothetical protein